MDFYEKKKRYSEFVKEKFKPKIRLHASVDKQGMEDSKLTDNNGQGSEKLKEISIKNSRRKFRDVALEAPDRSRYIEVGKSYL
jgi:hypothetical protein